MQSFFFNYFSDFIKFTFFLIIIFAVIYSNKKRKHFPINPNNPFDLINKVLQEIKRKTKIIPTTPETTPANYPGEQLNIAIAPISPQNIKLIKNKKYLQIALNNDLSEAQAIINQLPVADRILIEVGTPLIKTYGAQAINQIKNMAWLGAYIVADTKTADLASREVEQAAQAGAAAATCLGVAPLETINCFIEACKKSGIDSMIDMMNVDRALAILKQLKKLPDVVILHRGVDESEFSKEKQIPFYQIKQIKGNYNIFVAVAGGDTLLEIQRAVFNDADIVVIWKDVYASTEKTAGLVNDFLQEIK